MTKFRKNGYAETTRMRAKIDKLSKCMEDKKAKALANGIEVWCSFDELVPTERLLENPKNPNRHPEAQVELLAKNIKYFGWRHPVTASKRSGFIVAGHGRLAAAKKLGAAIVPVDYQDFNSDAEETAVLVADNKLAELSETSEDDLRKILSELDGIVDLELTGFSETEVELLLRDIGSEEVLEEDVPEVSENPLTNFGDVFEFGGHRLMCGDSTDPEQVKKTNGRKRRRYGFYGSALQRGLRRERTQNRKRQSRERLSRVPRKGHKKRLRIFRRRYLHLHVQFRNRHVAVGVP